MFKILVLIFVFTQISCSTYQSRRPIISSEIIFKGGHFEGKEWEEELIFKRFSWFQGVTLNHDILLTNLTKDAKFAAWMGKDFPLFSKCRHFKVALVYSNIRARQGNSYIYKQIEKSGHKIVSILDFSQNIQAHQNFLDWKLYRYRVVGLCESSLKSRGIDVSIPGFKSQIVK